MQFRIKMVATGMLVATAMLEVGSPSVPAATVAHWRFEAGPANAPVAHTGADGVFHGSTPDVSGNGNSLSAWTQGGYAGYSYRADVPFGWLPQNGSTNRFSVKNTGAYPALFTSATGSSPSGINAQTFTPAQFTVEASYKPEASGGYRTVVGRDARNVATGNGDLAALYLQVRPDDSAGILFTDVSGYTHSAYSPPGWIYGFNFGTNPEGLDAPWYHLAAVSDGNTLKMYVNNVLVATTDLALSGSPNRALARGTTSGDGWAAGAWSVGRGLYAGGHTDRAYGFIDEVRLSNSALTPAEFLAAPRPQIGPATISGGNLSFNVSRGQPGAMCFVLRSSNTSLPLGNWTPIATRGFDTNGNFSFTTPFNPANLQNFFALRAVIPVPPAGPLTYSLAGGSESWPANIRAQIVYAMDGAVALYNRHGTFPKHLTANYNPGVPTAQASYSGWIDFGGQIGYRTALHEIAHTLGIGTVGNWSGFRNGNEWTGANALQQLRLFDGPGAILYADAQHFWPYGLNQAGEDSTENNRRHVLMVAAFRRDLGIQ